MKCLREKCGKEFEPTTPKSKFCSNKCRTYYHRETKVEKPKEGVSLNEETIEKLAEILAGKMNIKSASVKKVEGKAVAVFNIEVEDKVTQPTNEIIDTEGKLKDKLEGEPKWKLKSPVMKVPPNLKGIARDSWIAEFKKANQNNNK